MTQRSTTGRAAQLRQPKTLLSGLACYAVSLRASTSCVVIDGRQPRHCLSLYSGKAFHPRKRALQTLPPPPKAQFLQKWPQAFWPVTVSSGAAYLPFDGSSPVS